MRDTAPFIDGDGGTAGITPGPGTGTIGDGGTLFIAPGGGTECIGDEIGF